MPTRHHLPWLFVVSAASFLIPQAGNSPCEGLRPLEGSQSQYRQRGNRCEGLYDSDVSTPVIELVSFVSQPVAFDLRAGVELALTTPTRPGVVYVRAVAKPPRTYYRMDARLATGGTLAWPVADVLLPEHLAADRLGVFGWYIDRDTNVFVPVTLTAKGAPRQRSLPALWIRPSFDAEVLKWRTAPSRASVCAIFGPWQDVPSAPSAGESVPILLAGVAGPNCVEVAGRSQSTNDWSTLRIRVDMPAP